jgi:hypothetical protein
MGILSAVSASAQTYVFNRADYATGSEPTTVAVGDFNHDGRMDVVVGNTLGASTVSVLLGKADGTFSSAVNYAVNANPIGVAVGDFNKDGKLDIVAISGFGSGAGISLLLGNGDGTFQPFTFFSTGGELTSIAVGDVNGDGKLDVVMSDNGSNVVDVVLGNGNGTFQSPTSYPTASDPRMVIVADFNGDHKLDLATANSGSGTVSVLIGNGDGTFQAHVDYATLGGCLSLAAGDLRHVGKLDIVAGTQSVGEVSVLLSNGDGTFQPAVNYSVPGGVDVVAVGDFDGNGKLDVATTSDSVAGLVSVLSGNGDGTLQPALTFGAGGFPVGIATADFNGDGKLDVVTANDGYPSGSISVLLSEGVGFFAGRSDYSISSAGVTGDYSGIAAADLNGDGKPDLVLGVTFANQISVLLNKGNGTFLPFTTYALPTNPDALATGDFNNDGKVDVAVMNFGGTGSISVLLNAGGGTFPSYTQYNIGGYGYGIAVGDFNKDGNLDIVATNLVNNTVSLLLGNGTGAFPSFTTYATGSFPYGVTVADFNHDGWPDLAVANQGSGTVSILLNKADGSGTFLPKVDYAVAGTPMFLATGSFRKNGILDLAVATNQAGGGIAVLLGNGDGTFKTAVPYNTLNNAYSVVAGDFNNDGKLDLAVAIVNAGGLGYITLMPGAGDGTFPTQLTLSTGTLPYGIVAADFNKDGGLDLATGNGTTFGDQGSATVILNYPDIGLLPSSINFGNQKVGTTSNPRTVTVSNPGSAPLRIASITSSGDFAVATNTCPATLTTGTNCTISVTFTPTVTGKRTGAVIIKDSAHDSPQKVALTGNGT